MSFEEAIPSEVGKMIYKTPPVEDMSVVGLVWYWSTILRTLHPRTPQDGGFMQEHNIFLNASYAIRPGTTWLT